MEVGQVNLAVAIDMLGHFDLHVWSRPHEANRGVGGVSVQDPDGDGDVVHGAPVGHWNCPFQSDEVPGTTVIKGEFVWNMKAVFF